ncbi:unnamed protein product [Prunus armeniaca]|uniref:Uncharacterized protein n=1 Tax=Prunus armeniaca TaxID=36596 RepID=A0A6J5TG14_PRUAR|nr:unnamed protein product [Prunus armeniaca]
MPNGKKIIVWCSHGFQSMTKPVRALFEHGDTAFDIWEAARKTYTEINCLRPHEFKCDDDGARRLKEIEANRVYDFLGGLDPPYDGVRSHILALSLVLPLLEAYAMVMEEDTPQSAMLGGGLMALKVDLTRQRPIAQHDTTSRSSSRKFSSLVRSRPSGSTPSSLDGPPKCRHCNENHYSEKCFKDHGYPDWFADNKARMYGSKAACTVTQNEARPPARLLICVLPIPFHV